MRTSSKASIALEGSVVVDSTNDSGSRRIRAGPSRLLTNADQICDEIAIDEMGQVRGRPSRLMIEVQAWFPNASL